MRPHNDIALTADPLETVAHLRASQAKWQETCQRLRAQRDAAEALAERRRVALEDVLELTHAGDWDVHSVIARIEDAASLALEDRVPDGASQVTS